jgi:hypothetical protein
MRLTAKEEKIARLALDKGAQPGERDAAAIKLINSLQARGVTVEDIEKVIVREKVIKLKVAMPSPPPTVVRKPPSPAPQSAYTAPKQTPETAEENVPVWRQVAVLLSVITPIGMILLFAGLGRQPPRDSASTQSLPSPEQTASAQMSPLPELTALSQVSPSPEPTVRRAQLVTPKETHSKRHPKD